MRMENYRLSKREFCEIATNSRIPLIKATQDILALADLEDCYYNVSSCELNNVRETLLSKYIVKWKDNLKLKPKLRLYTKINNITAG